MKPKGKLVSGKEYVSAEEEYLKKMKKKAFNGLKTAGLAKELKESAKETGYSKIPRVKPQKKIK